MTNQFLIFGAAALLLLGAGCAVTDEPDEIPKAEVDPELYEKAALLAGTIDFLSRNYADPDRATENKLYDAALRGMVRELDPYSGYEPPPEFQVNQEERSGEYAGIGVVTVKRSDHPLQIVGVLPDSPAAAAGIKPGEGILRIGNERTASLSLEDCSARIRGPAGSELQLELTGPEGGPTRMVTLKRAIVVRPSVPKESARIIGDGVGYLRIENFNAHPPAEFRDRLETLRKAGMTRGLILDLRGNPGGLVGGATEIASMLLPEGKTIFTVEPRDPRERQELRTGPVDFRDTELPLVILVNPLTASASELLAGALRDNGRARLVGMKTFGKGTLLRVLELPNGGALRYAASYYRTPAGHQIEGQGLEPDIAIELSPKETLQLAAQSDRHPGETEPAGEGALRDRQLEAALALFASPAATEPDPESPAATPRPPVPESGNGAENR